MSKTKNKIIIAHLDLLLMITFPIIASAITVAFEINFLFSLLLFFAIPSVYLSARKPALIWKTLISALVLAIIFPFNIDYLAYLDGSWANTTIFNYKYLGVIPIEDFIWTFLWVYLAIIFYEYFVDQGKHRDGISKNVKYFIYAASVALVIFFSAVAIKIEWLQIDYFYFKIGLVLAVVPIALFLLRFPHFWKKYLKTATYFSGTYLLFEFSALQSKQWGFPGKHFIGILQIGGARFPVEELLFFIILGSVGIISYYEYFIDDRK